MAATCVLRTKIPPKKNIAKTCHRTQETKQDSTETAARLNLSSDPTNRGCSKQTHPMMACRLQKETSTYRRYAVDLCKGKYF